MCKAIQSRTVRQHCCRLSSPQGQPDDQGGNNKPVCGLANRNLVQRSVPGAPSSPILHWKGGTERPLSTPLLQHTQIANAATITEHCATLTHGLASPMFPTRLRRWNFKIGSCIGFSTAPFAQLRGVRRGGERV